MNWDTAIDWIYHTTLWHEERLLGVWRAQLGPGGFSIFVAEPDGSTLELWAIEQKLYGKRHPKAQAQRAKMMAPIGGS